MTKTDTSTPAPETHTASSQSDLKERAEEAVETARKSVERTVATARDEGEKALSEAQDTFMSAQDSAMSAVRRNPGLALLGAVGVGVLLGMAMRGRD
ncbi:hypothetical protein ACG74X_10940 [Marivita sp. S0852]|uniref:hypothetical protein n=1 Tax=Marivita sp. S0852 TaxID=3373893 RepID=UPI00398290A9